MMAILDWFTRRKKSLAFIRSDLNYAETAGLTVGGSPIAPSGRDANSIIAAAIAWAQLNVVEPRICLADSSGKEITGGPVLMLLKDPVAKLDPLVRPTQTEHSIRQAVIAALMLDGNAYLRIHRNNGRIGAFSFLPLYTCFPQMDTVDQTRIAGYQIANVGGLVSPDDIVHIRRGVDPTNPAMGLSPLKAALRHVMADNLIAAYTTAILQKPTPGGLITPPPASDSSPIPQTLTHDQAKGLTEALKTQSAGKAAGGFVVFSQPVNLQKLDFSPADLDIQVMATLGEERIVAALGIPAVVLQIGAGLDKSTYANYAEARRAATEDFLVPMWELLGNAITDGILRDSTITPAGLSFGYNVSAVRALGTNQQQRAETAARLFVDNIIDRAEAREMAGVEPRPVDKDQWHWMTQASSFAGPIKAAGLAVRKAAENVQ